MSSINDQIKEKSAELKLLNKKKSIIAKLKKSKTIVCVGNFYNKGCGTRLQIKNLTYIQTHWYESPWGCTGGDTWHESEANFICPKCKARNRPCKYYDWKLIEDDKFSLIKYKFKNLEKEHKKD
jgi:hypothetical protein